jgi:hypothetical protein
MLDSKYSHIALTPEAKKYIEYINFHRNNVEKARQLVGERLCKELNVLPNHLEKVVAAHDMSRYGSEEFEPWRQHKFPCKNCKPDEALYQLAKSHHWMMNYHHPEHWVYMDGTVKPMEPVYIAEMFCDWISEVVFEDHEKVKEWYYKKMSTEPFVFANETQKTIEKILDMNFIP